MPHNKLFFVLFFLMLISCKSESANKNIEVKGNEKVIFQDSLHFFTKNFLADNKKADIIFFYYKNIEPKLGINLIANKIAKSLEGEECSPIDVIEKLNSSVLTYQIDSVLSKQTIMPYDSFYSRFVLWQADDKSITGYAENLRQTSNDFFIEEVLYDYETTRAFFTPYLKIKTQYWGSLNPNDFCQVYFHCLTWLNSASKEERKAFFKYLYKKGVKILSKKEKTK